MSLVAVYFWGPLVWGWIGGGSTPTVVTPHEPVATVNVPLVPVKLEKQHATNNVSWHQLKELIDNDPTMLSTDLGNAPIDPFRQIYRAEPEEVETGETVQVEEVETPAIELVKDIDPAEAGLELESVFVGRATKVAKIGGIRYRQQDKIVAASGVEFELKEVRRDSVVLTRNGREFTLTLKRKHLGDTDRNLYERSS